LGRNKKELKTLLLLKVDRKDWPHGTQDESAISAIRVAVQRLLLHFLRAQCFA
jgi:hypothetical protein